MLSMISFHRNQLKLKVTKRIGFGEILCVIRFFEGYKLFYSEI